MRHTTLLAIGLCCACQHTYTFVRHNAPVISSPTVADLDLDGNPEIIYGAWDGTLSVRDSNGALKEGWPFVTDKGFFGSPALADLDHDRNLEIIIGADTGDLYVFHHNGQIAEGWPKHIGLLLWSSPTIVTAAGQQYIAIASDRTMYLFQENGDLAAGWPQPIETWADATPAWHNEILYLTTLVRGAESQGRLYAWNLSGKPHNRYPKILGLDIDSSPTIGTLQKQSAIVFGDDAGLVHTISAQSGEELPGWPVKTQDTVEASAAVADIDQDGKQDIIIGSWDSSLYALHEDGTPHKGWPVSAQNQIISSAVIADITGDNKREIFVSSKDGFLYGFHADGSSIQGFPKTLGAPSFSSPWIGDLNQNLLADLVVGAANGLHIFYDIGTLGSLDWPMFRKNKEHHGSF